MGVKDLKIGSPVYRAQVDSIDIGRVRLIEQFEDGTISVELGLYWKPRFNAKEDATELVESNYSKTVWYVNLEDAELAQLMQRSAFIEKLKKESEIAQNKLSEAIQKYAFSEPSTPRE